MDRREGIQILTTKLQPELILLDDAYQHRKVKPDICILLTSYGDLYVDDWYLPTGNLRDCKSAAHRAELIIVTKCPPTMNPEGQNKIINKLRPKAHQIVLFSFLEYESSVYGQEKKLELDILLEKNITLVTGIANATPFVNHLKSIGLSFDHKEFKDHHFFTDKEIDTLRTKELILTTEKDFVRLRHHLSNLYYLPIRHKFMNKGKEVIFYRLNELMKERS
ncbi:tetraacyldisaccharide 4'-kinase [Maribacter litopenaei]|uniref:tetraacyldisaccharide 4'-kinase n=1 Tax=Maribacter litopenaei TaxID=2976127 RepID=UPI003083F9FF